MLLLYTRDLHIQYISIQELADGDGVYTPDPSTPYDTPMPHYQ